MGKTTARRGKKKSNRPETAAASLSTSHVRDIADHVPGVSESPSKTRPRRRPRRTNATVASVSAPNEVQTKRRSRRPTPHPDSVPGQQARNEEADDPVTPCAIVTVEELPSSIPPIDDESTGHQSMDSSFAVTPSPSPTSLADFFANDSAGDDIDDEPANPLRWSAVRDRLEGARASLQSVPELTSGGGDDSSSSDEEALPTTPTREQSPEAEKPVTFTTNFDVPAPIKGFHIASDGGIPSAAQRYLSLVKLLESPDPIGVQFFYGSPRQAPAPPREADVAEFRDLLEGKDLRHWTMHGSHTTNLASTDR